MVFVNGVMYEKLPRWMTGGGKPWVKIDPSRLPGRVGAALGGSNPMATPSSNDPSKALEMLLGVGKVAEVGGETVRGEPTTRYRITIDPEKLAAKVPAASRPYYRQLVGSAPIPAQVWVDDQGRLRKMSFRVQVGSSTAANKAGVLPVTSATYEYYDFGVGIDVKVPRPARSPT